MSDDILQLKLDNLINSATETVRLNESSRQKLYGTLAETYVTWRELQQNPTWLEAQYKKANIDYRTTANEANFRPFIKLIFSITETKGYYNNKIYHWQTVLRQLDKYYLADERKYRENAVFKLKSLIDDLGGISQIVEDAAKLGDRNERDETETKKSDAKKKAALTQTQAELAKKSVSEFSSAVIGIGSAKLEVAVRTDNNNLVALIGRKEADGSITVLGSTNSSDAMNAVALGARAHNYAEMAPSLKQITEMVVTQMFPRGSMPTSKAAQKAWRERIYYDMTDILVSQSVNKKDAAKAAKMTNPRRLLIRGKQGDILLSSMRSDVGAVTRCVPNQSLLPKHINAYMRTNERGIIEQWVTDNQIWLMSAHAHDKLTAVKNERFIFRLDLTNTALPKSKATTLHFYEQGRAEDADAVTTQTDFKFSEFQPLWSAQLDTKWFVNLRATFLDKWFRQMGKNTQLKRENNWKFKFDVKAKSISITYDMDATGIVPVRDFVAHTDVAPKSAISFEVRAKDIAPILYNVADASAVGSILVSGNDNAVVIAYQTEVGSYTIAIPTWAERQLADGKKTSPLLFFRTN